MTEINSNLTIEEATELAEVLTAEHEAHIVNDEIDAYKINAELSQVAETFDALEAAGVNIPAMSPEDYEHKAQAKKMEDLMANYMSARANHQPGKEFPCSNVTYIVQAYPHQGMWTRNAKKVVDRPNLKNNSVRRKLAKNPNKYTVSL